MGLEDIIGYSIYPAQYLNYANLANCASASRYPADVQQNQNIGYLQSIPFSTIPKRAITKLREEIDSWHGNVLGR